MVNTADQEYTQPFKAVYMGTSASKLGSLRRMSQLLECVCVFFNFYEGNFLCDALTPFQN